jgi:16S rRNA (cytidine1402-2'-O)-methyltransferase
LLDRLSRGERIALVTDAGTPGVSDPGVELVAACRARGIPVEPVPGASAALLAAIGSGFPLNSITFLGFPPFKSKARNEWLEALSKLTETVVFFESPHRIATTLQELGAKLGKRQICVAREMTKAHEEFVIGPADDPMFLSLTRKGEFSIVVAPQTAREITVAQGAGDDAILASFRSFNRENGPNGRRQAVNLAAKELGLSANDVYRAIERAKI